MYHTPQGVVYAAASASTLGALPEYLFNLQQSQTAFVSPDQQGILTGLKVNCYKYF